MQEIKDETERDYPMQSEGSEHDDGDGEREECDDDDDGDAVMVDSPDMDVFEAFGLVGDTLVEGLAQLLELWGVLAGTLSRFDVRMYICRHKIFDGMLVLNLDRCKSLYIFPLTLSGHSARCTGRCSCRPFGGGSPVEGGGLGGGSLGEGGGLGGWICGC